MHECHWSTHSHARRTIQVCCFIIFGNYYRTKKIEINSKLTLCPCTCFDLRLRTRAKLKGERDGNLDKEKRNNSFTILICHGIFLKLILFPCSVFPVLLSLPFHFLCVFLSYPRTLLNRFIVSCNDNQTCCMYTR